MLHVDPYSHNNIDILKYLKSIDDRLSRIESILQSKKPLPKNPAHLPIPKSNTYYPEYIKIGKAKGSVCLSHEHDNYYFRDAGNWRVSVAKENGRFFVHEPNTSSKLHHIHGTQVFPATIKEWKKSNEGYV